MSPALAMAGVLVAALTAYLLLGGADFGAGVWDLLARGPRKQQQRELIEHAIGPIWEANHVWLIFAAVVLFGAFPAAFAAISTALHVPLTLFLVGIVFRGSAFVFRSYDPEHRGRWGPLFSIASVISPFLLGAAVGTLASGRIRMEGTAISSGFFGPWLAPFPFAVGALTLALCAFLAATYLAREAPEGPLREDFRHKALGASAVLLALSLLTLGLAHRGAPRIFAGLIGGSATPVVVGGALAALIAVWALSRRKYGVARLAAGAFATLLFAGWAISQHPYLIVPDLTLDQAASNPRTLQALLWATLAGVPILGPSLWLLFKVFKSPRQMPPPSGA